MNKWLDVGGSMRNAPHIFRVVPIPVIRQLAAERAGVHEFQTANLTAINS